MTDTIPCGVRVDRVEVVDRGRLHALTIVTIDIAGVELTLQGVRLMQRLDGGLACEAPVWRHPLTGQWLPGMVLPPELGEAIAQAVYAEAETPMAVSPDDRASAVLPRNLDQDRCK